jgi:DNA polymerase I-like protein with 3'-5' exonuclease and polymerase domains
MKDALKRGIIHERTASFIFDKPETEIEPLVERYIGKKCNHAFNYRMGPYKAAESINKEGNITVSVAQTKMYHEKYHQNYMIKRWWSEIEEKLSLDRTITTIYGRRYRFYSAWGEKLFKDATAFEPQSTVADHVFGAIQDELGIAGGIKLVYSSIVKGHESDIKIVETAHDSIIVECPNTIVNEIAEQVVKCMRRPMVIKGDQFTIPVDCKVGERWDEGMTKLKVA